MSHGVLWEIHVLYNIQISSGWYIVFHIISVSLSNNHVLYTFRLGFESKLIIYVSLFVCPSVSLSVCLYFCSFSNRKYTFVKNHVLTYFTSNERTRQPLLMHAIIFKNSNFEESYDLDSKFWKKYFFSVKFTSII